MITMPINFPWPGVSSSAVFDIISDLKISFRSLCLSNVHLTLNIVFSVV